MAHRQTLTQVPLLLDEYERAAVIRHAGLRSAPTLRELAGAVRSIIRGTVDVIASTADDDLGGGPLDLNARERAEVLR